MHPPQFFSLSSVAQTDRSAPSRKLRQGLKKSAQLLLLPLAIGVLHQTAQAQTTASTEIVGFNTVTALGNSDTRVSFPLHRSTAYQGVVQSVSGNTVTIQGAPAWTTTPKQWQYAAGTQRNVYYLEFGSGAKEGMYYTVTDNGVNNVTLNLNGDDISTAVLGDTVRIIPYWSLATLFPNQTGITTTTAVNGTGALTKIIQPDITASGIDIAGSSTYYYYSGSGFGGPGWRLLAGGFTNIKDDDVILPDLFLVIRQFGVATSSVITATGSVALNDRKYVIGTNEANKAQDNSVSVDVPVVMTLDQSNLYQSGAFAGTTAINGTSGDRLLIWDDTVIGYDKAAVSTYYYYTGPNSGGPGWRLLGGGFTNIKNSDQVFKPGIGFVIRKQATASPTTVVWSMPLPY